MFSAMFGEQSPTAEADARDAELFSGEPAYAATFRSLFGAEPASVRRP